VDEDGQAVTPGRYRRVGRPQSEHRTWRMGRRPLGGGPACLKDPNDPSKRILFTGDHGPPAPRRADRIRRAEGDDQVKGGADNGVELARNREGALRAMPEVDDAAIAAAPGRRPMSCCTRSSSQATTPPDEAARPFCRHGRNKTWQRYCPIYMVPSDAEFRRTPARALASRQKSTGEPCWKSEGRSIGS